MVDSREGSDEAHPIHDVCLISLMSPSLSHSRSLVQQINVLACRFITVPPGKVSLHFYYSKLFSDEMLHQEINYATDAKKRGFCRLKLSAWPFFFPAPFQFLVTLKIHQERDIIKALQLCPEVSGQNPQQNICHVPAPRAISESTQPPVTAKCSP